MRLFFNAFIESSGNFSFNIFFEFDSRVNGAPKEGQQDPVLRYTYIQYLLEPGKTLVFSFNCSRREKQDWQETARLMMKSIKVKSGK